MPHPELNGVFVRSSVRALLEDREQGIWAGSDTGVVRIREGTAEVIEHGGRGIRALVQEKDGTIQIGTVRGLRSMRGTEVRHYGKGDGLSDAPVDALCLDARNVLWVGTEGAGLVKRDGARFVSVTSREGLPDDTILQIVEDDSGRLWLGTNRGIAIIEKGEAEGVRAGQTNYVHPTVIRSVNGLPSDSCMPAPPVKMHDGRLAFATMRGFLADGAPGGFPAQRNDAPGFD